MEIIFHQEATGVFFVKVVSGTPHCGVDDQNCRMEYKLEIGWKDHPLDRNGFLLDNTWFAGFFQRASRYRAKISCERLAQKLATRIFKACGKRAHCVKLSLSAVKDVWIEAEVIDNA